MNNRTKGMILILFSFLAAAVSQYVVALIILLIAIKTLLD